MLFNSYLFLFIFLPLVLGIYYLCGHLHTRLAAAWVCLASLIFYGGGTLCLCWCWLLQLPSTMD